MSEARHGRLEDGRGHCVTCIGIAGDGAVAATDACTALVGADRRAVRINAFLLARRNCAHLRRRGKRDTTCTRFGGRGDSGSSGGGSGGESWC